MNCDVYWALNASAFSVESLMMMLSGLSTGMLLFDIGVYFLAVFCDEAPRGVLAP